MFKAIQKWFGDLAESMAAAEAQRQEERARQAEADRIYVQALKQGRIPVKSSSRLLNSSESCFLECRVTQHRNLKAGVKSTSGTITVTNTRIIFVAEDNVGNWETSLGKVLSVQGGGTSFQLQTSSTKASGRFDTHTPHAGLIVESATKLHKRLLDMGGNEEVKSRRISQEVKAAVWQRDRGQCVECGAADYLEFDHVIPFSRGGANTEGNIQLLCRRCNLAKSDKI